MARRFRFRLETVRKVRERDQAAQQRVLARAVQSVTRVGERVTALTEQLEQTIDASRDVHEARRLDMRSLLGHQVHRGWLHRKILESGVELLERKAQCEAERARLAEASKRLKVIDNLRDRQWARYRREVARGEQAAADEIGIQRYLRSGTGEWEARS